MKRLYIFFLVIASFLYIPVKSQDVELLYDNFVDFLRTRYPSCFYIDINGSLMFRTNCVEVTSEDSLTFHGISSMNLEPIKYFTSLVYLDCSDNEITYDWFPFFPSTLKYLNARNSNDFASYPEITLPSGLEYLNFSNNTQPIFTSTNLIFPSSLKYLNISDCFYSELPALPPNLDTLICNNQSIWGLMSLPSLPATLKYLDCSANSIDSLPPLPSSLQYLNCSFQKERLSSEAFDMTLGSLPNLPLSLQYLDCSSNKLTNLPELPSTLTYLNCTRQIWRNNELSQNPFTNSLVKYHGINCLPQLPLSLSAIFTGGSGATCLPNAGGLTSLPLPICTPINNSNHCFSGPIISGRLFYDINSNGTKEPTENYRANVEAYTNSGFHAFTNDTGYFELPGDTGFNVINITTPPFYSAIPSTNSYTFNSFDTLVSQLYALQPQVSADSVSVSLARINPARRGFVCGFQLHYENVGTTTLQASIVIGYNPSYFSYLSASMPGVTNNGSQLTIPAINLSPGDDGNINLNFNVLQTATLGDTTYLQAQATAGSSVMHDSVYAIITGSFDPNDKNATPILAPQQVAAGTFINYFIRFQNTGNDTAINVVVTDTLDTQLDPSSFQLISTSHNALVKRDGRNLSFEFLNIMLPDSNVNEPQSHGYIRFRVKPLSNLIAGSVIPNIADIYFDYNEPVTTNNTNTTIPVTVVPLTLLSFNALSDDDKKGLLRWTTASEINTLLFEIEHSTNGVNFKRIGSIAAAGRGDNNYTFNVNLLSEIDYFRLRIIDRDNRFSFSEIKKIRRTKDGKKIYVVTNPARKTLTINCTHSSLIGTEAVLFDHTGKKILVFKIKGGLQDIRLTISNTGLYYLRTADGTKEIFISAE